MRGNRNASSCEGLESQLEKPLHLLHGTSHGLCDWEWKAKLLGPGGCRRASQVEGLGHGQAVVLSLWDCTVYPVALSASSLEGVNSVAQGKELPAPFSWRGHVWLTQQWGCSKGQSSGNGAVSSAASLLQSSVAIPSAQQHLLFLLGQGGKEAVGEEEVTNSSCCLQPVTEAPVGW